MSDNIAIRLENVSKDFGKDRVLKSVTRDFERGKIHGVVGNNGSGKTVMFKCICGFLQPTEGKIFVDGKRIGVDADFPEDIGIIIETPGFLPQYTGVKNLEILASLRKKISVEQIAATIRRVGLDPTMKKPVGKYSLGMRQRLGIAQAIMEQPSLMILEMQQSFTVYVSITDGKKSSSAAELFITGYKVSPEKVNGGDDFDVTVTIKNIGGSEAKKVRLTYDGTDGEQGKTVKPKNPLNTIRVSNIAAGATKDVKFTMTASKDAIAGSQSFMVNIAYSGGELSQVLTVDVVQPLDVSVDEVQMPQEVVSGESVIIPISILNKGKAAIYDVTAKLDMDGCYGYSVYIGEVAAGTTGYAEMKVFIGTLSQGSLYGGTFGSLNITYKEADGSEYTETTELRTTITEPITDDDAVAANAEAAPQVQPISQWYVSVIVGIAVIAIAVALIMIMSYQRKLRIK